MTGKPLLQIKNLTVRFVQNNRVNTALEDFSVEVNQGELLAIVGESGSGKTVASLSILQLLPAATVRYPSGEILFDAEGKSPVNLLKLSSRELEAIRGNQISMVFQEPMTSLNPLVTCGAQIMEAIRLHEHKGKREARENTLALLERVRLPDPASIFRRYPHQLSGGQKQRVMIAMAISCGPRLLICDEPTTALDVSVQKDILALIKELQQRHQMAVIFITHDLGLVSEIADRAVVMYRGRTMEQGQVNRLFSTPGHPYTKALLSCRPILHSKKDRLPVVSDFMEEGNQDVTQIPLQTKLAGPPPVSDSPPAEGPVLARVEDLKVHFPGPGGWPGKKSPPVRALDGVSFEIFKGETLGLVGESGCGKTTLGRCLLRLQRPTAGRIFYQDKDLAEIRGNDLLSMRRNIQLVFQDPYSSLNPRLTVGTALEEPLQVHRLAASMEERIQRVESLLSKVNLPAGTFRRFPHEFSGGQRQRIVIARALILSPSFVVFDESVSALDVSVQAQVLNLINDLKRELGFTAVFISHDLSVVHYICDRILVMRQGRIEELGDADQVFHNPRQDYTKRLLEAIPGRKG